MTPNFVRYSRYYDLFYKDKNYEEEATYVLEKLAPYLPQGAQLLELGCGTGGHAEPICNAGYQVTGIDRSAYMIEQAKEKKITGFTPLLADITSFAAARTYDGAYSLFHVISYLTTNEALTACFKTVWEHLKPGGVFCFDCWHGPAVLHELPATRIRKITEGTLELTRTATPLLHVEQNVVEVQYDLQIRHGGSKEEEGVQETHLMRYFTVPEIEWIAGQTGFTLLRAGAFMSAEKPGLNTWNLFALLQKKPS